MERNTDSFDRNKIKKLLLIGILGAVIILAGDLLMGWGVQDPAKTGLAAQLSPYLAVSDGRMVWAAVLGFTGVPIAVVGHYGIYQLLRPYSRKYAGCYAVGILGFLAVGGAGVHVSSVEAAFFYKYLTAAAPDTAVDAAM